MSKVIHNVEVFDEKHYEIDPAKGAVLKHTQVLKRGTADTIAHDGETFSVDADGSFHVPDDLAALLLKQPGWYEGPNPFVEEYEAEAVDEAPKPARKRKAASKS
jgi:hypothetical protein